MKKKELNEEVVEETLEEELPEEKVEEKSPELEPFELAEEVKEGVVIDDVAHENVEEEIAPEVIVREDGVADPVLNRNEAPEDLNYDSEPLARIEEERKVFLSKYKKQNSLKWVVSLLALAAVITIWIVIPNVAGGESWSMPVMISSIVGILALLLLYTFWIRRSLNTKMKQYFLTFYSESNKFVFDQEGFDKVEAQIPDKINKEQFTDSELYKDIIEVGSRGLTAFEYKGIPAMVCDCAGQIKTEKRIAPAFVGKYLFAASNYEGDDPIIVYIKGDKRSLPPTNVEDKKAVHDDNKFVVWTNNSKWESVINTAFKKLIGQVKLSNDLVDLAISITKGRMFIAMGYDDPLMVLPLEKPYNPNPVKTYKKDIAVIAKFIELLNK